MQFTDMINGVFVRAKDPQQQRLDPGAVEFWINRTIRDILQDTGLLRQVASVAVVDGVANLRPHPDVVLVGGKIKRVEDATTGVPRKIFGPAIIDTMESFHGKNWRNDTEGPIKKWIWGTAKPLAANQSRSTQDGYSTILVYPLVPTGTLNIHFMATPKTMTSDADVCDVPDWMHDGIVDGAAWALLRDEGNPAYAELTQQTQIDYKSWVERGINELTTSAQ